MQIGETGQIILLMCVLVIVFFLTRKIQAWRMKRAYILVIEDLKREKAFDPESALILPYAKTSIFRFGTRDYRPKAIQYLMMGNVLGMTEDGRYFLKDKDFILKVPQ
jgi:hypothetical protein